MLKHGHLGRRLWGVGLAYDAGPKAPRGTPMPKCLQHKVPLEGPPGGQPSPEAPGGVLHGCVPQGALGGCRHPPRGLSWIPPGRGPYRGSDDPLI